MNHFSTHTSIPTRVAVFASYNDKNQVADYVVYLLRELQKVTDAIIFVADNDLPKCEINKISEYIDHSICHRHGSYDFGSYRIGFQWALSHGLLADADELLLLNDSCYGPVYPFEQVFGEMERRPCHFWGLVESHECTHHIQSFFMVFRRKVFMSPVFCNFVNDFRQQEGGFWDYVDLYERRFTEVLEAEGFMSDVYVRPAPDTLLATAMRSGNGNTTLWPVTLHRLGMPMVKVKAITGVFGNDLQESPEELLESIKAVNPELYQTIILDRIRRGAKAEDRWLTPQQVVGTAEVVSFDIFDTLLSRPFLRPTDLFLLIEREQQVKGFARRRIASERRARRAHSRQADVSLDQIYEAMGERYGWLKAVEIAYERRLLTPKADGLRLYSEAVAQGRQIIAVSDMYLPSQFLLSVLHEKGYEAVSQVFVSCEQNACKQGGKLFRKVMELMGIRGDQWVHIGDNHLADKASAEAEGLRAVERPKDTDQLLAMPAMRRFRKLKVGRSLALSANVALQARHKAAVPMGDPYGELGYELGGPLAVGYVEHIHRVATAHGVDGLLFVSRDGYALYQVYQMLYPDSIKAYYVEASRKLIIRNKASYADADYQKLLWETYAEERLDGQTIDYNSARDHQADMEEWAADNSRRYNAYIASLHIEGCRLMTVDMTTLSYTSLRLLAEVFGRRIWGGMFSTTHGNATPLRAMSYDRRHWHDGDEPLIMLAEELITAPQLAAFSISADGQLARGNSSPTEHLRIARYGRIMEGIRSYASDYRRLLCGSHTGLTMEEWKEMAQLYVDGCNYGAAQILAHIYHEDTLHHSFHALAYEFYQPAPGRKGQRSLSGGLPLARLKRKQRKHLKAIRLLAAVAAAELMMLLAVGWL